MPINHQVGYKVLKSFCLRDGGKLGNEGWPILLKIGTQCCYVDFCNMPKFQLQWSFFSQVLDIITPGVPRGWFSVQFWPRLNLSFSNVQLILDKKKNIFVMPYSKPFMGKHGNFSLASGCCVNLDLFEAIMGSNQKWPVFKPYIFHAHVLYREVLNIPAKFSPWFSNIKKKIIRLKLSSFC